MLKKTVSNFVRAFHLCEQHSINYWQAIADCGDDDHEIEITNENWCSMHPYDMMISSGYPRWIAKYSYKLWRWSRY